jgi:hypothetical protein
VARRKRPTAFITGTIFVLMELRKLQALSGILAPVFFFAAVVYMSLSRPGYSHVYNVISELGETGSPTASAASVTFIVTGLMIILFGLGLHSELSRGGRRVWTGAAVALYGLLDFVGSGVFPCDPGGASRTFMGAVHANLTVLGELAALAAPFLFLWDTEGREEWGDHRRLTYVAGAVFLVLAGYLQYTLPGHVPGEHDTPVGLAQRLLVAAYLTWISATGAKMYVKNGE